MERSGSKQREAQRLARSIRRGDLAAAAKLLSRHAGTAGPGKPAKARAPAGPVTLEKACPGRGLSVATPRGPSACYLVRGAASDVDPRAAAVEADYSAVLRGARQQFDELDASPGLCHAANARPEDLLIVRAVAGRSDSEMVFLVGLMSYTEGRLAFEQLLARRESEEAAVLSAFADRRDAAGVLVTFPGRTSELKQIQRRCELHGIEPPYRDPPHLDLRAEARKQWRKRLPRFTLPALQTHLLGRPPGARRPAARPPEILRRFLQTSDPTGLADLLDQNGADLLSMAQLTCLLLTASDPLT